MKVHEPLHTRLELRFRLFGVPVRVGVLFWLSCAVLGVPYYADPELGTIGWFAFWVVAVLFSVLVHELGHVLAGRLFGMRGQVVLYGLGGLTLGIDELPRRWQRVAVLLAGPLAGVLVLAGVWGLTFLPPAANPHTAIAVGIAAKWLLYINLFWTSVNLLPLWPLDGGRVICEVGEGLFGRRGLTAALLVCLGATALLTLVWTVFLSAQLNAPFAVPLQVVEWLRFTQTSRLWLLEYGYLIVLCYLLWVRTFRALWPEPADAGKGA
jgi:membrane-associated protease RseP (regulator of RpoE activity)